MTLLAFPYSERQHPLFGQIQRPLLRLHLRSERFGQWLAIDEVLADTGADLSVVPFPLGQVLVSNITEGQPIQLGGVISSTVMFNAFVHRLQAQLGDYTFEMPLAVATSLTIPPIFGRREALDRFTVSFTRGKTLTLEV